MSIQDLNDALARSNRKARRGRWLARHMLALAFAVTALTAFLFIASPNMMGGGPQPGEQPMTWLSFVGLAVGILWMWRIYRADPEPPARAWRYRAD